MPGNARQTPGTADAQWRNVAPSTSTAQHRAKLHSTNPLERLDSEIWRHSERIAIFTDQPSIIRSRVLPTSKSNGRALPRRKWTRTEKCRQL